MGKEKLWKSNDGTTAGRVILRSETLLSLSEIRRNRYE